MQIARKTGIAQRRRRRISCSSLRRRVFFRSTASRRCIAPQGTMRNRLLWNRWMTMGIDTAAIPASRTAFRNSTLPPHSQGEVLRERLRVGAVGRHRHEVDAVAVAALLELGAEALEVLKIGRTQMVGIDQMLLAVDLQAVEARPLAEGERELLRIPDLEDHDLVVGMPEMGERREEILHVAEAVRQDDEKPAAMDAGDEVVE